MASSRLTGPRKAAILLLTLGEDAAAEVLKQLSEEEVRAVTHFMSRFEDITPQDVDRVLNEYFMRKQGGRLGDAPPETKIQYLQKVLAKALGDARSAEIMQGISNAPPGGALEKLKWHAPRTIARFVANEHPQVIAVILATMEEPGLAERVLGELPSALQGDVAQRLAGLKTISPAWIDDIQESLADAMLPATRELPERHGGAEHVAEVLTTGPRAMETAILAHIEQKDPALADRIRGRMFRFEDFIRLDNLGLQRILGRSSTRDLVLALRVADDDLREHIYRNLSNNHARMIQDELDQLGPTRVSEIEGAQLRLIALARELMEKGEVSALGRADPLVV
jgi:flagellar motor switch protein FliG